MVLSYQEGTQVLQVTWAPDEAVSIPFCRKTSANRVSKSVAV